MVTMRTLDGRSSGGGASPKRSQSTVGFQRHDSRKNRIHVGQGPNQGMTMQMLRSAFAKGGVSSGRGIIMRRFNVSQPWKVLAGSSKGDPIIRRFKLEIMTEWASSS